MDREIAHDLQDTFFGRDDNATRGQAPSRIAHGVNVGFPNYEVNHKQRQSMSLNTSILCFLQAITRLLVSFPLASTLSQLVPPRPSQTSQVCIPLMW
jgi:hypothetical protein